MKKVGLKENYREILNEDLDSKLDVILEYVKDIPDMKSDIKHIKTRLDQHEVDIDLLKLGIRQHSKEIKELKKYLPA